MSRYKDWLQRDSQRPLSGDKLWSKLNGSYDVIFNFPSEGGRWFQVQQCEQFLEKWHAAEPTLEAKQQVYKEQTAKKREIMAVSPHL